MTEYASRKTEDVMTERFSQRDGRLSIIGICNKIDQEFLKPPQSQRTFASNGNNPSVPTGRRELIVPHLADRNRPCFEDISSS